MKIIKTMIEKIKNIWGKRTLVQKIIFFSIIALVVIGCVTLLFVSASFNKVSLFVTPIDDKDLLNRIITRINQEGYSYSVNNDGIIKVENAEIARKLRAIMIREDLVLTTQQPWDIFDTESWTITDFERNIKLQRSITNAIVDHLKAIDGIDNVKVNIVWPEKELFTSNQNPISASITIIPKPDSDITKNQKKIEGIQKILKFAIEGLKDENIVITDQTGIIINDFEDLKEID